ncbi:MAG: aldo/keto reductase [Vicinamibacteria bacterium]|nr:aldo/keto reductase [Vicinamibacteria bacterium]
MLGCGNFGGIGSAPAFFGKGESEEEAAAIMDAAFAAGINVFDTADAYGGGRSEEMIGRWLARKGSAVRDQLLLSSKVFNPVGDGPNDWGLSRRHIFRQVEASLRRLGADHLDIYLIHEPDPTTPVEETLWALDDLVREGKVRYIGASNMPAWLTAKSLWLCDSNGWTRFEWIQNSFSLLDRRDEAELFPLLRDQGLGFTPFSPLAGGWLTGKYARDEPFPEGSRMTLRPEPYGDFLTDRVHDALDALRVHAAERGVDMATLALAWVVKHPRVTAPIVGPRSPGHLEPALQAIDLELPDEEWDRIGAYFAPGAGG